MRKWICVLITLAGVVGFGVAQSFTDVDNARDYGKSGIQHFLPVIDANFALVEGGVTLSSSATAASTWSIDASHASATGLYSTVSLLDTSVLSVDTDYGVTELFTFNNDQTQEVVAGSIHVVVDDNTDTTEDTSLEFYSYIGGSATKVLDFGAATATIPLAIDANGLTVDDGSVGAPSVLVGGTTNGFYHATDLQMGVSISGVLSGYFEDDGWKSTAFDSLGAGLAIGEANATSVTLGAADANTSIVGGFGLAYALKTANYTNTINDCVLTYDTSAATTNTLPEASTALGLVFMITLQDDDGDLVVMTDGTDKFDGTNDILTFTNAGDNVTLMATAANVYSILSLRGGTLSN
jgi:hypothetical protein